MRNVTANTMATTRVAVSRNVDRAAPAAADFPQDVAASGPILAARQIARRVPAVNRGEHATR